MLDIIIIIQDAGNYLIWPLSVILLILILLQGGAGDISSAFGGGGQLDSSLGVGAQQKISKVTGWFVAIFLILVVILSIDPNPDLGQDKEKTEQEEGPASVVPVIDDGDPSNDEKPVDGEQPKVDAEAPKEAPKAEDNKDAPADDKVENQAEVKPEKAADAKKEPAKAEGEGDIEVIE